MRFASDATPDARQNPHFAKGSSTPTDNTSPFVAAPSISLPKGGGAITGTGEKFATNQVTGAGSISVPIATSPGRGGFGPALSLTYESRIGNGSFGVGWHLGLSAITLKTEKGIPTYRDDPARDVFMLSSAEDLVAVPGPDGERVEDRDTAPGYVIRRFRPRIEGLYARIERWQRVSSPADTHWRSLSADNILTIYGRDDNSRITDPADPTRIYSWLIAETRDDRGNAIVYGYKAENSDNVPLTSAHEAHRGDAGSVPRTAHRHIKSIRYGNTVPLLDRLGHRPAWVKASEREAAGFLFEIVFDYGEHHAEDPKPDDPGRWPCRLDPFSTYRPGFEVRDYRLCRRILMFHHFPDEPEVGTSCLVRSTAFDYRETPAASFIVAVEDRHHRRREAGGYLTRARPKLEFEYSQPVIGGKLEHIDPDSAENLAAPGAPANLWIDLDGEGLTGLLCERAGAWLYKRNESPLARQGTEPSWPLRFGPLERVAEIPGATALADRRWRFADIDGDGRTDVLTDEPTLTGFYRRTDDLGWTRFRAFASIVNLRWEDPDLRLIDLTGDGLPDILITGDRALTWHASLGERGFGEAERIAAATDEDSGPRVVFSDPDESIFLADFSGDGLTDIVRIRNGGICYWPNLGYGRFGAKVAMDRAPRFDDAGDFDPRRIRLVDIDGSGPSDIIYLGRHGARFWYNQAGNGWSAAQHLPNFPPVDDVTSVTAADLLGNGTACLAWRSPLSGDAQAPLRCLPLMADGKPHLLVACRNNLGIETKISYAPSTVFYLRDRAAGKPWITRLPFPVHVVERVETLDFISRNRFVTRYSYHHGHFDGIEREFRGFGRVDQWDTEELGLLTESGALPAYGNVDAASYVPPVLTRSWYHTGISLGRDHVSDFFAGLLDAGDAGEYYREPGLKDVAARERLLPDSTLPTDLSAAEEPEACRALKGLLLRREVYGLDGGDRAGHPYVVSEANYAVRLLQRRGGNHAGVFAVAPGETLSWHYERNPDDPRLVHSLVLELDPFGNVLKRAEIGYGRRDPDPTAQPPPAADLAVQQRVQVSYAESELTHAVETAADHLTPLASETRVYELTGYSATGKDGRFRSADFVAPNAARPGRMRHLFDGETDYGDVPPAGRQRRLVEHLRTLYRPDDFGLSAGSSEALLPLGSVEPRALAGESYRLAHPAGWLEQVFRRDGAALLPANPGDLIEGPRFGRGGYVSSDRLKAAGAFPTTDADGAWWAPSGRVFLSPGDGDTPAQEALRALAHFFSAVRFRDPFGSSTIVTHDRYDLLLTETRDAAGNRVTAGERMPAGGIDPDKPGNDYRVLQARRIMDANRNRIAVSFDVFGLVAGTAVMGKPGQAVGDSLAGFAPDLPELVVAAGLAQPLLDGQALLSRATSRVVYDLFAYQRTRNDPRPQPAVAWTMSRETHDSDLPPPDGLRIQHSFAYSDGFGRAIQAKLVAEPGPVPMRDPSGAVLVDAAGQPRMSAGDAPARWVGSGWTVFDNKGRPVRQFEPFFSDTHRFDFDARIGVSPILFYDPVGRVVARLHPDHRWEKTRFTPWRQESWTAKDTVTLPDPATDPDVGDCFARVPAAAYLPRWIDQRLGGAMGPAEQVAARRSEHVAGTPAVSHTDSLGRPVLAVAHNKAKYSDTAPAAPPVESYLETRSVLDIQGNLLMAIDARGRVVVRCTYDMLGTCVRQASMEAGERWTLPDVAGNPLCAWDSRGHRLRTGYDVLRRPVETFLQDGGGTEIVVGKVAYGEAAADPEARNLRGKAVEFRDQAGLAIHEAFDFKGNLLASRRRFASDYRDVLDWSAPVALEDDAFASATRYDALNRVVQAVAPHGDAAAVHVVRPGYNRAGLLETIHVWTGLAAEPAAPLDRATASFAAVTNVDYDARGQRSRIAYGNGVETECRRDPLTLRLVRLVTRRDPADFSGDAAPPPAGWPGSDVQRLSYTYDAAGNIVSIRDDAQQSVFFRNRRVEPSADYTYDALSRLIEARGREHLGQAGGAPIPHSHDDVRRLRRPHPADGNAMGTFVERYIYDPAGNLERMRHAGTDPLDPGWTRSYVHDEPSQLDPGTRSNRLTHCTIGGRTERFSIGGDGYDAHGSMLKMPQLQEMRWDFGDRLRMTRRQAVGPDDAEGERRRGECTWSVYDSSGQRVRKVTEFAGGGIKEDRLYLGGVDIYRRHGADALARETLHVMDGAQRVAMVDRRIAGSEPGVPAEVIRYQLGNHLGSASLELDGEARLISYEEYSPYGSTTLQTADGRLAAPKRYRFTGKERDEESGLSYHGARYYAPWLGRWTSCDPIGISDGPNLYQYASSNPVALIDPSGMQGTRIEDPRQQLADQIEGLGRQCLDPKRFTESELRQRHEELTAQRLREGSKRGPAAGKPIAGSILYVELQRRVGVILNNIEGVKKDPIGTVLSAGPIIRGADPDELGNQLKSAQGPSGALGAVAGAKGGRDAMENVHNSSASPETPLGEQRPAASPKSPPPKTPSPPSAPLPTAVPSAAPPPAAAATAAPPSAQVQGVLLPGNRLNSVNPHFQHPKTPDAAVQGATDRVVQRFQLNPRLAGTYLTSREQTSLNRLAFEGSEAAHSLAAAAFGKAVERALGQSTAVTGLMQPVGQTRINGRFAASPDFRGTGPFQGRSFDTTTETDLSSHLERPYASYTYFATYRVPQSWYNFLGPF